MKIRDTLHDGKVHISFEIFPPKTDAGYNSVVSAAEKIAALKPSFISVTYGAGGGTSPKPDYGFLHSLPIAHHLL